MQTLSPRLPRAFCLLLMCALGATQLLLLPSSAAPAQAQSSLKFDPNPVVIGADPVRLTIRDEAGTELKPAQGKFSADTNEYVNFNPETLELTPKKSGKTKLKITFTPAAPPPQTPTPTPTASPTASSTPTPVASPTASPTATPAAPKTGDVEVVVKFKSVALAQTVLESGKAWEFVGGQKIAVRSTDFSITDVKGGSRQVDEVELVPANSSVLKGGKVTATTGEVEALAVKGVVTTKLTPRIDGQDYAPIDVKISESVKGFTVLVDGQPFTESGGIVKVPLPEGTKKMIEVKPVGRQESVSGLAGFGVRLPDATLLTVVPKDAGKYEVTANVTGSITTDTPRMSFTAEDANAEDGSADDVSVAVEFQVIRKNAYIELLTPQSVFLMRGGRLNIEARVKNKQGNELNQTVTFSLPEPQAKSGLWVTLSQSGNKATLSWRDPTEAEVRAANNNELVRRPTQMVVKAKAGAGVEEITGEVTIYMGEVSKFTKLKVKLNQMDERTASDLYGTVMAKEYYVMSVRLFNNLKDEESQEYIGSSILAYSASIEMAVQLEKKFDGKTGSAFKNVIKGDAAKAIADKRSKAAGDLALTQAENDITFARDAQAELQRVADAEREAVRKAYDLYGQVERQLDVVEDLRGRAEAASGAERTRLVQQEAEAAREHARLNGLFEQARAAAEQAYEATFRVRENIARQAYLRRPITQTLQGVSDPDTAIDDGKWHLVTRADLERIAPQPRPAEPSRGLFPRPRPLEPFSLSESVSGPRSRTDAPSPEEPPDPPCAGVVTYRPFTFEMMVNTVDRRDGRSLRSKVFKVLDFVGISTSYVTSVAVPGNSSDLPLGLEKYRNLLLPSLDRLVPNYKEQQRQNIVSQAMKEIEEIPFGSDITRVIFIPKKTIRGIIRGHETRISEICPFYFSIDVAIIQKGRETVTAGSATP